MTAEVGAPGGDRRDTPLVSVVVPTHRRAEFLAQCLPSLLAQTMGSIEVIVVVDGADEATESYLADVDDDRVRVMVHRERRGVSGARNAGIGMARGDWVAFCDDDDVWAPTKLAEQLAALDENPDARWVITSAIRIADGARSGVIEQAVSPSVVAAALPYTNPVPGGCSGTMADRSLVMRLGSFNPRLSLLADLDLWIRLNWTSPVAVVEAPLVGYRDHPRVMTRRIRDIEREVRVIRRTHRAALAAVDRRFPDDRFYLWVHRRTFKTGDWVGGVRLLAMSHGYRAAMFRRLVNRLRPGQTTAIPAWDVRLRPSRAPLSVDEFTWLAPITFGVTDSGATPSGAGSYAQLNWKPPRRGGRRWRGR